MMLLQTGQSRKDGSINVFFNLDREKILNFIFLYSRVEKKADRLLVSVTIGNPAVF